MKNEEPKTTITIDIIYNVSYPPSKDAITHTEIDSSYLPKLKRFSKELSNPIPTPSAVSPAGKGVKNDKVPAGHHGPSTEKEVKNGK